MSGQTWMRRLVAQYEQINFAGPENNPFVRTSRDRIRQGVQSCGSRLFAWQRNGEIAD